jgi:hypothetical protein
MIIVALPFVAAAIFTPIVATSSKSARPVKLSVRNVLDLGTNKLVTVEFKRCTEGTRFAEVHRIQIRQSGRWQPPLSLTKFGEDYLLTQTNREQVVFSVPVEADMCRFSVGYRVGPRPYCQAYFFFRKHGLLQKFPKLSKAVLKYVPQQPRLRRVRLDLVIPPGRHSERAALTKPPSFT